MGIGLTKCDPYNLPTACKDWTTGQLDDMKNLLSIQHTISGLGISICVFWKVLCPLWKYKDIPGEFVKKNNVKRQPEYKDLILFQVKDGN